MPRQTTPTAARNKKLSHQVTPDELPTTRRSTRATRTNRVLNYKEYDEDDDDDSKPEKASKDEVKDESEELDEKLKVEEEQKPKKKRKRAAQKRKESKAKTPRRASTPPAKKQRKSKKKAAPMQSVPPRSVAALGLPLGSKGVGRGGFEIRSLDGIPPLLTVASVTKAIKLCTTGQYHDAARLLGTEHDSIQSFCHAAATAWGMDGSALAGLKGRGSSLSRRARARLEQGLVPVDSPLPGRLLVVHAGHAISEFDDEPLCPPALVGQTFESADDLHDHTTEDIATYAMDAKGDPAFGQWKVVMERLEAANLLPSSSSKDTKPPFLVRVDWDAEKELPVGSWEMLDTGKSNDRIKEDDSSFQWGLIEGSTPDAPPVIIGVSIELFCEPSRNDQSGAEGRPKTFSKSNGLLPNLSPEVAKVRLPASLLQKSIRRNFCSPAPLLEASRTLLFGDNQEQSPLGGCGTFQFLTTIWKCMLEDASPFDAPDDGSLLGFEELLLLSLVASADSEWVMPPLLASKAVIAALRTQQQPASFSNIDSTPMHADNASDGKWVLQPGNGRDAVIQNALVVVQAALGGKFVHRSSFQTAAPVTEAEATLVHKVIELRQSLPKPEPRLQKLDQECRLAAYDTDVAPSSLVFAQAALPHAPGSWKKHSLPAIAKQVQKLIVQVNTRMPDHHRLTRIAAWGNNNSTVTNAMGVTMSMGDFGAEEQPTFSTAREAVTTTGKLSEKEHQIIDCFESVQKQRFSSMVQEAQDSESQPMLDTVLSSPNFIRMEVGAPASKYDGRMAFLLAFGRAEEIEVTNHKEDTTEVVNVLFCGDATDPLLVQRIGKARKEAEISAEVDSGSSGAKAVPSLGYVQRSKNAELVEAAEKELAAKWKGGRTVSLPLPPPGFQWKVTGHDDKAANDDVEKNVKLTATLAKPGKWNFTINNIPVEPFNASSVISACALDLSNHRATPLGPEGEALLKVAFYVEKDCAPSTVLETLGRLHDLASKARASSEGVYEGQVYDWIPFATDGGLTSTIWRDAILAIKTRESDDVVLGPISSDGKCKRDMTEGCLLRIFSTLEFLYPTVLVKNGALKWRVRPRGAGYFHMLSCLEQLSRGIAIAPKPMTKTVKNETAHDTTKRPQRMTDETEAPPHVGRRVEKLFDGEPFGGTVASYDKTENMWTVKYDDGDIEEYDESDMEKFLLDTPTPVDDKSPSKKRKSQENDDDSHKEEEDFKSLPEITTSLWPHQEASVSKVVEGVKQGRRGHADASAVGAGKTLTALATIVRLVAYAEECNGMRNGVLVMLPTKALISEWLIQIASHTKGFHVVEQREDGQLFSLTYGRSGCPIDGSTIVISTLDRVREHPFRQASWDFVVIDECLAVQNSAAKRCPSAWRQIETSLYGVLLLSATFFRSKYTELFYMIRMLRCPLPRSMEWLAATIHECIVCQVPENDRSWEMRGEAIALPPEQLRSYRNIIESFKRKQLNNGGAAVDARPLFTELGTFLRNNYEGREKGTNIYNKESIMAKAFYSSCKKLLDEGRRPLVFADTAQEAQHILSYLCNHDLDAQKWSTVAQAIKKGNGVCRVDSKSVIVATKSIEGQGINMQQHADAIVCRPTPGDLLEQMKGRVDRPGQTSKALVLVVLMAEHTFEEAKFSNIHLAGNFFREYIAPVAQKYKEKVQKIDLQATLAAGGTSKLKSGTVSSAWRQSLKSAGQSGAFAESSATVTSVEDHVIEDRATKRPRRGSSKDKKVEEKGIDDESKFAPRNKVFRNKGDPEAVRQAKEKAKQGQASLAVRRWLFPPKKPRMGLPKESLKRFSDATPPVVMDEATVRAAVTHLSKDPVLEGLVSRVGADALIEDCTGAGKVTNSSLFNYCVRAVTFTMISVDAGNSFMRRLAMKIGACLESMSPTKRQALLEKEAEETRKSGADYRSITAQSLLDLLLSGSSSDLLFTPGLVGALVETCLTIKGERTGYPHLCGETFPCGKNDDHGRFLEKARSHAKGLGVPVSAGYSKAKADFIISMVEDFKSKVTAEKISKASDQEAAKMILGLRGIGDWCAGGVLMHCLKRGNIMLYGDLTVRNYLNDLYDINHNDAKETVVQSAADFPDNAENRNLIDALVTRNGWEPYRSVVCLLMYHLEEEDLVLL